MSKASCCGLSYMGENHNPVHIAKYCRNCGYVYAFEHEVFHDLSKQLETIRGMCGNPDAVDACRLISKRLDKIIKEIAR